MSIERSTRRIEMSFRRTWRVPTKRWWDFFGPRVHSSAPALLLTRHSARSRSNAVRPGAC